MPIFIQPPVPTNGIGPGILFDWYSNVEGPLPDGSFWQVQLFTDADTTQGYTSITIPTRSNTGGRARVFDPAYGDWIEGTSTPKAGDQVYVKIGLNDTTGFLDESTIPIPWNPTDGLGMQLHLTPQGSGGLTDAQAQQLQETHDSVAPLLSLDPLTLDNLTPSGPSAGPINAQLPGPIFGVIVRLASVPDDIQPTTPDGDYWIKTLAVVRIFRGSDLWLRVPVHTSNKMIPLEGEGLVVAIGEALTNLWLLNLSVQVTFLEGVTGSVFLMRFP